MDGQGGSQCARGFSLAGLDFAHRDLSAVDALGQFTPTHTGVFAKFAHESAK